MTTKYQSFVEENVEFIKTTLFSKICDFKNHKHVISQKL